MELKELKHNIEHNTLDTNLVIMKYSGNGDFIIHQYLNKYITDNNLELGLEGEKIINDMNRKLIEHAKYIVDKGEDLEEIKNWRF